MGLITFRIIDGNVAKKLYVTRLRDQFQRRQLSAKGKSEFLAKKVGRGKSGSVSGGRSLATCAASATS